MDEVWKELDPSRENAKQQLADIAECLDKASSLARKARKEFIELMAHGEDDWLANLTRQLKEFNETVAGIEGFANYVERMSKTI